MNGSRLRSLSFQAGAAAAMLFVGCQLVTGSNDFSFTDGDGGGGKGGLGGDGSTTTGMAGAGGQPTECQTASDCTGPSDTCAHRACVEGVCSIDQATAGTPCTEDDGAVCNGDGACVACITSEQCDNGFVCAEFACLPMECVNGVLDLDETDVDCGGTTCAPCKNDKLCEQASDCESQFCSDTRGGGMGGAGGAGGSSAGGAGGSTDGGAGGAGGASAEGGVCAPCAHDGDCDGAPGTFCNAGACVAQNTVGTTCSTDNECASGACVDGFCCASACDGECVSCAMALTGQPNGTCAATNEGADPDGECADTGPMSCGPKGQGCNGDALAPACKRYGVNTECGSPSCMSGSAIPTAFCDGAGSCNQPNPVSCEGHLCGGTACLMSCGNNAQCESTYYCNNNGDCVADLHNGGICTSNAQCASGQCVDGLCCDTDCTSNCTSCKQAHTGEPNGTCANILDNLDPYNECLLSSCDGAGNCG